MLSTKNLPDKRKIHKTIQPGNIVARLNGLKLDKGYNPDTYNVLLFLETEDLGADFEGFLIDKDNPDGARYKGQVGRVKLTSFEFAWTAKNKRGEEKRVDRDDNILRSLKDFAIGLGKLEELNEIEARNIEEFVTKAAKVLIGNTFYKWCIAGKEYTKDGYTNYDLYLPYPIKSTVKDEFPCELATVPEDKSQLMKFDPAKHIYKKKPATVNNFAPTSHISSSADDDLPF